jgi:hypothetical protein
MACQPLLPFVVHFRRILSARRTCRSARVHASSLLNCNLMDDSPILSLTTLRTAPSAIRAARGDANSLVWELEAHVLRARPVHDLL